MVSQLELYVGFFKYFFLTCLLNPVRLGPQSSLLYCPTFPLLKVQLCVAKLHYAKYFFPWGGAVGPGLVSISVFVVQFLEFSEPCLGICCTSPKTLNCNTMEVQLSALITFSSKIFFKLLLLSFFYLLDF